MSKLFEDLKASLEEVLAHTQGAETGAVIREVPRTNVATVRARLGMSQSQFATVFGVSVGTLRGWEQRRRVPEGPAQVLLAVIDREPEAVLRALHYDYVHQKGTLEERSL